jgi:dTDP-4-amino-4,6-dideoxygalactose transaminase
VKRSAFPPWPFYADDERAAVDAVLRSGQVNYWTGPEISDFEREHSEASGTKYAIALANGTLALEMALAAFDIGEEAEVVTTPRTFVATASSIVLRGARPVFADVDPDSQNITAAGIERVLSPRTRAILLVHLAGWPCEMDQIMALARTRDLIVLEDCAQASGASYRGRSVGSIGNAGAFSFCQDKIITTGGEGGMFLTNDAEAWGRAWPLKDHGKSYEAVHHREHPPGFRWLHESFGSNWRMTAMQAAIGRVQLHKLPQWSAARARNAAALAAAWRDLSALRIPTPPAHVVHAWYKFYAFVRSEALRPGWSRDRIIVEVNGRGVPCFSGSCPEVYLEKAFRDAGLAPPERLPVARELGETSLMFLVHPTLGDAEMSRTIEAVRAVLAEATR